MSGVFGVFHTKGQPVDREDLSRMDAAMAYWGTDGGGVFIKGPVALASRLRHITVEDTFDSQPLIDGSLVLVAHARLDNRDDLCRELGLGLGLAATLPESALILAAYRRYGEDCVQHLRGDWVFALWDDDHQRLLIARDATGNTGLYWWADAGAVVFSTGMKGMLAHPLVPQRPDALAVAGLLTVYSDPSHEDATVYEGIRRLTPGNLLTVNVSGVRLHRWWRPEFLEPLARSSLEAYYEEFLPLYEDAVAQRLRVHGGTVAATLSAGLDSGSVVAMAAPRLAQRNQRLAGYVHAPLYAPTGAGATRTGDEFPLAQKTAAYVGNVDPVALRTEHISVLQGIEQALWIHDAPGHAASNEYWMIDILQTARDAGARVLLTGQGGNATVSFNGDGSLWPVLRSGRWVQLAQAIRGENGGPWAAFKNRLLKPAARPVRARVRRLVRGRVPNPWASYSSIHQRFADELRLGERMRQAGFDPTFSAPMSNPAVVAGFRLGTRHSGTGWAGWMEKGAAHGLDVRDPTRDQRLLEFCWCLPDAVFWGRGEQRALIRRGMQSELPPEVLLSRSKGLQSADFRDRLLSVEAQLDALFDQLKQVSLAAAWLDLDRMQATAKKLRHAINLPAASFEAQALARDISVGLFLRRFP